jgi:hypothetical protein
MRMRIKWSDFCILKLFNQRDRWSYNTRDNTSGTNADQSEVTAYLLQELSVFNDLQDENNAVTVGTQIASIPTTPEPLTKRAVKV